jgi:hypothetical protein
MTAAAGLALGGCARGRDVDARVGSQEDRPTAGMVTVKMTFHRGSHGALYIEGAMAEVILRDAHGKKVDVQTKEPRARLTFTNLEPGTYILEPALRPCDANCGYLDPRVDSCSRKLEVDGRVNVKVDFTVGSRCTIHTY